MNIFKDMIYVQKNTFKKSILSFKRSWPIIFTAVIYMFINVLAINLINLLLRGVLSIIAGFIFAIISSSLISNYLYLLYNAITYNRITFQNFKDGFTQYLWKVYGIFFIAWIGSYALSILLDLTGSAGIMLYSLIRLLVLVFLNPLPETIYQKYYSSVDSIKYAFDFIKENWLNWFVPNIILFGIIYLVTGRLVEDMFTTYLVLDFRLDMLGIIMFLLGQSIFSFTMIYRGHLFSLLSTSTRRKRMYMNRLYED